MAAELSKVLVVDDDDDMRELAELSLAQFGGMEVQVAKDYEQALATLAVWTPDLVLCDVMMPNVSGPELLRMIRERWTVPVVFLTARASLSDTSRYMELGAAGVLAKPFDPMTLSDEVRKVFAEV